MKLRLAVFGEFFRSLRLATATLLALPLLELTLHGTMVGNEMNRFLEGLQKIFVIDKALGGRYSSEKMTGCSFFGTQAPG